MDGLTNSRNFLNYFGIVLIFILWWLVKISFFNSSIFLPSPLETVNKLYSLLFKENLSLDLLSTLKKFGLGYLYALLIGLPIGFVIGLIKKLYFTLEIVLDFFRSIPVTTMFPLFILFFGIDDVTIVSMVTFASVFIIILNTSYGVFYINKEYLKVLNTLNATKFQLFKEAIIPASLPFVFIGFRVSVSLGLIVVIVSEMFIGTEHGLGIKVYECYETYLITDVYAIIFLVGILGYFSNKLIIIVENKVIHWK